MSTLVPPPVPWLTRRAVGAGCLSAAGLLASGCSTDAGYGAQGSRTPADGDRDRDLVRTALADERRLLTRVEGARARHQELRRDLAVTAAVHRAHVELLAQALGAVEPAGPSGSGGPRAADQALAAVRHAERELVAAHTATAMAARSGRFARLLAAMAAAAAQQEQLLSRVTVTGRSRR